MTPTGSVEQRLLQLRVDDLERRLARLEAGYVRLVEELGPRAATPAGDDAPRADDADDGLEGARLVALELLSAGYGRQEVAEYLRSTFAVADPEGVVTAAGSAGR